MLNLADIHAARTRIGSRVPPTPLMPTGARVTFDFTFDLMKRYLDSFVLLSEAELAEGVRPALRATHNLAEGAGAAQPWRRRSSCATACKAGASWPSCPAATAAAATVLR